MSQNFVCTKFWVNYFVCLCDAEFERYGQKGHLPYILEITALCNIYGKAQSTIFYGHEGTGKHKYFNQNYLQYYRCFGQNLPVLWLVILTTECKQVETGPDHLLCSFPVP